MRTSYPPETASIEHGKSQDVCWAPTELQAWATPKDLFPRIDWTIRGTGARTDRDCQLSFT